MSIATRRGAFADARHPHGVPDAVARAVAPAKHAAAAIAALAGEAIETMPPERFDEFRQWALLAATLAHRDGRLLVAYHLERARRDLARVPALDQLDRDIRLAATHGLAVCLRATARYVAGLGSSVLHHQVVGLMTDDRAPRVPAVRPSRLDV